MQKILRVIVAKFLAASITQVIHSNLYAQTTVQKLFTISFALRSLASKLPTIMEKNLENAKIRNFRKYQVHFRVSFSSLNSFNSTLSLKEHKTSIDFYLCVQNSFQRYRPLTEILLLHSIKFCLVWYNSYWKILWNMDGLVCKKHWKKHFTLSSFWYYAL